MASNENTLYYVVYKYMKNYDKKLASDYKFEDMFDKSSVKKVCIVKSFENEYKKQSKKLNSVLKVFGIEDSHIMFSNHDTNSQHQYDLKDNELDFIIELLHKLNEDDIWKKIKNIDNRNYNGFVQLYKKTSDKDNLISEIKFAIDGFLNICERKYSTDSPKYKNFHDQLYIFTQFNQLVWMNEMESILFNTLPINKEDVENSKAGILLYDYQNFLDKTTSEIKKIINIKNTEWELKKKRT